MEPRTEDRNKPFDEDAGCYPPLEADSSSRSSDCSAFDRARLNDPIVHAGMRGGCDYEEIIAKMFERHEAMTAKLMELEMIAPRRIRVGDHDMEYHTPDHLIPLQNESS